MYICQKPRTEDSIQAVQKEFLLLGDIDSIYVIVHFDLQISADLLHSQAASLYY